MQVSFPISAFGCKLALTGSGIVIPKVFTGGVPKGVQPRIVSAGDREREGGGEAPRPGVWCAHGAPHSDKARLGWGSALSEGVVERESFVY